MLVFHYFHLNIDGIVGIFVACFVLWGGYESIKDTLNPKNFARSNAAFFLGTGHKFPPEPPAKGREGRGPSEVRRAFEGYRDCAGRRR